MSGMDYDDDNDRPQFEDYGEAAPTANDDELCDDRADFNEPEGDPELLAQMQKAEKRDEERQNATLKGKRKAPNKVGGVAKAPRKKRAAPTEQRRRRTTVPKTATKIEKMRMKHMNEAMRDPQRIIDETMRDNAPPDVARVRMESVRLQQQAIAALRELEQLTKGSERCREAVKQHADLRAQMKRAKQLAKEEERSTASEAMNEMVLEKCVEALVSQASTISTLHSRMDKLVRLYSDNTAKCEAATRRSYQSSMSTNSLIESRRDLPLLAPVDPDAASVVESSAPAQNTDQLFSLQISNGVMDLTTRSAPQHIIGRPGSAYINFSMARRNGGAQQLSQSSVVRRLHNVQRLAKLKRRTIAASKLLGAQAHLNGEDASLALTNGESAGAPKLAIGSADLAKGKK